MREHTYIIIIEFADVTEIFPHIDATVSTNLSNLGCKWIQLKIEGNQTSNKNSKQKY